MNKKRLLKLADMLDADASNRKGMKFDLGVIAQPDTDELLPDMSGMGLNCGTVGCAIGLACLSGAFARAGLGYQVGQYELLPTFKGVMGFDIATAGVFGLTEEESDWLFMPDGYENTPRGARGERMVARRIRNFVAGKASPPKQVAPWS